MRCSLVTLACLGLLLVGATASALPAQGVEVMATALLGNEDQPYGVATIELPLAEPVVGQPLPPVIAGSDSGRVLYPVSEDVQVPITPPSERPVPQPGSGRLLQRLGKLIQELADPDAPKTQTVARRVTFLFTGQTPVRVRLAAGNRTIGIYELTPRRDPANHANLMAQWWQAYVDEAREQIERGDYPPWVETYLTAMLSGRTGQGLPEWYVESDAGGDPLLATLKYLAGAQEVAERVFRMTAAGLTDAESLEPASTEAAERLPVPAGPRWQPAKLPAVDPSVETEPIASRIPPECFYIRFGSFENYLWFLDLSEEYGGDVGRMITLRGTAPAATERFQQQLALRINDLTRMVGPTVIEDQAVIGRDLFTLEGATMGVLMKAANAFLLRTSLASDRSSLASQDPSLTLKEIQLAGHNVSFLSSPDNRVRSFLVEADGYFLITNSRTLARRFVEVGRSGASLAKTDSFRLSRSLVPVTREDTIFAYFSPAMLQGLVSPEYLVELRRRAAAGSDIALVHLARLAAAAEGLGVEAEQPLGVADLVDEGFLPVSFGNRVDGSGVVTVGSRVVDTLRGARGSFLPIADVDIEAVSAEEAAWYRAIAQQYSERFPQIDPIVVALRREPVAGNEALERLVVHAEIAPMIPEKYGKWAQQLGPPTQVAMRFAPDDLVAIQAHVASEPLGPPTHLFAGIKDTFPPEPEQFEGILQTYWALRELPAYLGAWPRPGALDRLPLGLGRGRPVGPGMSRLIGGLYRYTGGGFSVLSFQPEVLNATLPFLEANEVEQAATVRGRVGSLLGSRLEGWVNNQLYQRAARSSVAGAAFLDLLQQQLQVPPARALQTAERVLGAPLQCSLGGEYEFDPGRDRWISSVWDGAQPLPVPPENHVAPILHWFRGAEFTMTQYSDRLVADGEIVVARAGETTGSEATGQPD